MRNELYDRLETDTSKGTLIALSENLPEPMVILGGWAVYLTVNERFKDEHGYGYLGSRDVDMEFHIDSESSIEKLKTSTFARTLKILNEIGYEPSGSSRFCRMIHRENGRTVGLEESKSIPMYNLFYLYIDPIVDYIHPRHYEVFSIKPIDEPIMARAFKGDRFSKTYIESKVIHIPEPDLLIAMKLKSFPDRQKGDKKIKDACDIYALLWHSKVNYSKLVSLVKEDYSELCPNVMKIIESDTAREAAKHLDIDIDIFTGVLKGLSN